MKRLSTFFLAAFILPGTLHAAGPLSGTSGGNLTSFNGNVGSMNNNNWNSMANPGKPLPAADFGNCNSLILRCAQPKCSSGGCTDMDIARPIVSGCVNANDSCKSYGDDLIDYIAAQLVADSNAKFAEAQAAANASQAASQQSAEQLSAMQSQMESLQQQIASQNEQNTAAMQAALARQNELLAQQQAAAAEAAEKNVISPASTETVQNAVNNGVSAEVLVRQQASGQIMTSIENAEDSLKALKKTMQTVFDYAGCDASGNNCTGPKRISVFKDKANDFFDPYENVLDETYDALIMAQALGLDISYNYMLLNNSCNAWGKYLCNTCSPNGSEKIDAEGNIPSWCNDGYYTVAKEKSSNGSYKVAGSQPHCTFMQLLNSRSDIQMNWLDMDAGSSGGIRVACASDVLDNSMLFRSRKKQSNIDIETLQRIIEQDSPNYLDTKKETANPALTKYCATTDTTDLKKRTTLKTLPDKVCVSGLDGAKTAGTCDKYDFVNPDYALCTTAAYNVGMKSNPDNQSDREQMNQVVALKTTVIAQQMKKQYDYLEATIKRLKTQLEKAVLTTNMQVAGAAANEDSYKSNDKNVILSDAENCKLKTSTKSTMECFQTNIRAIRYAISNGNTNQAKKQLQNDLGTANLYSIKDMPNCENISSLSRKDDITKCVDDFSIKVMRELEDIGNSSSGGGWVIRQN